MSTFLEQYHDVNPQTEGAQARQLFLGTDDGRLHRRYVPAETDG